MAFSGFQITRLGLIVIPRPLYGDFSGRFVSQRKAVQKRIYDLLIADATLATLAGATATDLRVYQAFNETERTISSAKPGFVALYDVTMDQPFLKRERFIFQVSTYARSLLRCRRMADRIDAVLHRQALNAADWSDVSMIRTARSSAWDGAGGNWQLDSTFTVEVWS